MAQSLAKRRGGISSRGSLQCLSPAFWRHRRRCNSAVAPHPLSHVSANRALRTVEMLSRDSRWEATLLPAPTSIICTPGVHTNCGNFEE
eukprot:gene16643-biopygen18807